MEDWEDVMLLRDMAIAEANVAGMMPRTFHERDDAFELTDTKFKKLFRMPKQLVTSLIEELEPVMIPHHRATDIDIQTAVLITLRFLACGAYQTSIGQDINLAVCQPTVSRSIARVTAAINEHLFDQWVQFPLNNLAPIKARFQQEYNFPGVIGAIDCTHVAIIAPNVNDDNYPEYVYVNRKHYHSINVQLVCDADMRILNVKANYPGSTNDAFIWRASNLKAALQRAHRDNVSSWLLGDSGYPLEPWLFTPIQVPQNDAQVNYNEHQMRARSIVERCNGLLKSRWRCLLRHRVLHYHPEKASQIITAATVLHNICVEYNVPVPPMGHDEAYELDFGMDAVNRDVQNAAIRNVNPLLVNARRLQQRLIRLEFNRN